jgi:hypothetical protein
VGGVVHIPFYATILRQDALANEVSKVAPLSLRYGATQYAVHRSRDDRYKILLMVWFESKEDWYSFWEGPEMTAFRRRNSSHYQILLSYVWQDELAAGALGPEVPTEPAPEPEPEPQAAGST